MIPDTLKESIRKAFAEHLHIKPCGNNHETIQFSDWPYAPGHVQGRCDFCGHVITRMIPGFVEPKHEGPDWKSADFDGPGIGESKPEEPKEPETAPEEPPAAEAPPKKASRK